MRSFVPFLLSAPTTVLQAALQVAGRFFKMLNSCGPTSLRWGMPSLRIKSNQTKPNQYVCVCEKGRNDELPSVASTHRQEHYVPYGNEACATNAFTSTVARQVGLIQARSFFGIECGIMMHQEQT
jgi:hypothetical protein